MTASNDAAGSGPAPEWRGEAFGVSAAIATPFNANLSVDAPRMAAHCAGLLGSGCSSVTLFGTTGEGVAVSLEEKADVYASVLEAGVAAADTVFCVAAPALGDAAAQAEIALKAGGSKLLVAPPFYFKDVSDDGLYAWFMALLERLEAHAPRLVLYHIPQVTGVALSTDLIARLRVAAGDAILGVKDSGGDWPVTQGFLDARDYAVLVGDERHLARAARLGCSGTISGMANLFPQIMGAALQGVEPDAAFIRLVDATVGHPVTPAVKALIAGARGEEGWARVRPPLEPTPLPIAGELVELAKQLEGY